MAPTQDWLDSIGLGQVDVAAQALVLLGNLDDIAAQLIDPLQSIAVASIGAIGMTLIIFFLSIYMVIDRDQILAFLFRLVPPSYAEEARLLQTSVARSFGGFLRGQALMGLVYFGIALVAASLFGLPADRPHHGVRRGPDGDPVLRPVRGLGAARRRRLLIFVPEALLPMIVIMVAGWFVVMNIMQPRIMQGAVGIHPIVVLGSVLIGSTHRGHPGRHLRHPGRGGRVGVLLPLPAATVERPDGGGPGGEARERARGPAGARCRASRCPGRRPTSRMP